MNSQVKYDLKSLSLAITKCCDLRCSFCTREAGNNIKEYMSIEFIENIIDEALSFSNIKTINITGGEPFLHPNIDKILKVINERNLEIRINTNGLHFTEDNINLLNKYNVKLFTISLDSSIDKIHDSIRGVDGSFDKTMSNLKRINKEGYKFFIKATVTEKNVDTIYDLMKMVDNIGAYGFSFSRTIPVGRGRKDKEKHLNIWNSYKKLGRECSNYSQNTKLKFLIDDPLRHFFDVRSIEVKKKNLNRLKRIWGGCTAGLKFLYILPSGNVLACPALIKPIGNVYNQKLKDIWFNSDELIKLRNRDNLNGNCRICENKYICGGCRASAYAASGDIMGEDPFCPLIDNK